MPRKLYWLVAAGLTCATAGCDDESVATGSETDGSTDGSDDDDDDDDDDDQSETSAQTSPTTGPTSPTAGPTDPSDTDPMDPSGTDTDEPMPSVCGNGVVEAGEDCDGRDLGGESCGTMAAQSGALSCTLGCSFETCGCVWDGVGGTCGPPVCGNGVHEEGEWCDGGDLPSWESDPCEGELGEGYYGNVSCDDECRIDTSSCDSCGDGVVQEDHEECDGPPLNGSGDALECRTYLGPGFGGDMACTTDCRLDETVCEELCGNGVLDFGEACDGDAEGGATCEALGFEGGAAGCNGVCEPVTTECVPFCGNGVLDPDEQCDGDAQDGTTCESLGFASGALTCDSACEYITSTCETCGNGVLDVGEGCDGDDFGTASCGDYAFGAHGTLTCSESCGIQAVGCNTDSGSAIFSEIMPVSLLTPQLNDGEWVELHNPDPDHAFGLGACSIRSVAPFETFEIPGGSVIPAGGYITFGKGTLESLGFAPDVELPPQTTFLNDGDTLVLYCGSTQLDAVIYGDGAPWPALEPGVAIEVRPENLSALGNDMGSGWCESTNGYATGFLGTPGSANICAP